LIVIPAVPNSELVKPESSASLVIPAKVGSSPAIPAQAARSGRMPNGDNRSVAATLPGHVSGQ
jgi:hypothetical protein